MFSFNAVQLFTLANLLLSVTSFTSPHSHHNIKSGINVHDRKVTTLLASGDEYAPSITGAELEVLLTDFETPLVVDAYATWCGPCLLMAPEFEAAAKEFDGKVRFCKLDTDKEPEMANRLNIMGLPTVLFLDKIPEDKDGDGAKAVLKQRIEGALRKDSIIEICNYHFFDGPVPAEL